MHGAHRKVHVLFSGVVLLTTTAGCLMPADDPDGGPVVDVLEQATIYGTDDRYEHGETVGMDRVFADATGQLYPSAGLTCSGSCFLETYAWVDLDDSDFDVPATPICPATTFYGQRRLRNAACSVFLVGPDLLVTAAHCLRRSTDPEVFQGVSNDTCEDQSVVFGFNANTSGVVAAIDPQTNEFELGADDIYDCEEIVARTFGGSELDDEDWTVFRVDRPVQGRIPLWVRYTGDVSVGQDLQMMGYPDELPMKVSSGEVKELGTSTKFNANLDAIAGNSGSMVVDSTSAVVQGILTNGPGDWVYNSTLECADYKFCAESGCTGVPQGDSTLSNIQRMAGYASEHIPLHVAGIMAVM